MFSAACIMLAEEENDESEVLDKNELELARKILRDATNPLELPQTL